MSGVAKPATRFHSGAPATVNNKRGTSRFLQYLFSFFLFTRPFFFVFSPVEEEANTLMSRCCRSQCLNPFFLRAPLVQEEARGSRGTRQHRSRFLSHRTLLQVLRTMRKKQKTAQNSNFKESHEQYLLQIGFDTFSHPLHPSLGNSLKCVERICFVGYVGSLKLFLQLNVLIII